MCPRFVCLFVCLLAALAGGEEGGGCKEEGVGGEN